MNGYQLVVDPIRFNGDFHSALLSEAEAANG